MVLININVIIIIIIMADQTAAVRTEERLRAHTLSATLSGWRTRRREVKVEARGGGDLLPLVTGVTEAAPHCFECVTDVFSLVFILCPQV